MSKCTKICAGDLRYSIDIQAETIADDGYGGQSVTWPDIATGVRAKVRRLSSGEIYVHDKIEVRATHEFIIRYRSDVTARSRIIYRGAPYNISGPPENIDEENKWLKIVAVMGVTQ
jgi:SPP1 family predicted phage head-tail adaptor